MRTRPTQEQFAALAAQIATAHSEAVGSFGFLDFVLAYEQRFINILMTYWRLTESAEVLVEDFTVPHLTAFVQEFMLRRKDGEEAESLEAALHARIMEALDEFDGLNPSGCEHG
jgi:hypothetical protein